MGWSDNTNEAQWFANYTTSGVTHYTFAHLDQRTGYLKPYEGDSRIAEMAPLVLADVERVKAGAK